MQSFEMHTEISIEVYAPYPPGNRTLTGTYQPGELPPYLGKGIVIRPGGKPEIFSNNQPTVPSGVTVGANDVVYTAHNLRTGNKVGEAGVDPCLKSAPKISESLSSLIAGIPESSSISFTLLNPELQRFFSSDFVVSYSLVQVYRVVDGTRNRVWTGIINKVAFSEIEIQVSARPNVKRLDSRATFGFEDKIPQWDKNDFKIPIVCAQLVPYTVEVLDHPPQVIAAYDPLLWYQDWLTFIHIPPPLNIPNEQIETEQPIRAQTLAQFMLQTLIPKYYTFSKQDLVPTNARFTTGLPEITPNPSNEYIGRLITPAQGVTFDNVYGSGFWMDIDRGIFILNSEDTTPTIQPSLGSLDPDPRIFRGSVVPDGTLTGSRSSQVCLSVINPGIEDNRTVPRINRGTSFVNDWGTLKISRNDGLAGSAATARVEYFFEDDDGDTDRPIHPFDGVYRSWVKQGITFYTFAILHGAQVFDKLELIPTRHWPDYWVTRFSNFYLNYPSISGVNAAAIFEATHEDGTADTIALDRSGIHTILRSKDMYSTEPPFGSLFQTVSPENDADLQHISRIGESALVDDVALQTFNEFTLWANLKITSEYKSGSNYLKLLPAVNAFDNPPIPARSPNTLGTEINYERAERSGGAYYVSARKLIPFGGTYKDFAHIMLRGKIDQGIETAEFLSDERIQTAFRGSFDFYYHHDMYNKTDVLLKPSTFLFAVIKNAGLNPGFAQDGSSGVPDDLNSYRMQLISDTDTTYRDLLKRVLPGLGYIARYNPVADQYELRNIAGNPDATRLFGDHMMKVTNIQYDVIKQFSSFFFENDDMLRGKDTLSEFRYDPLQSGRFVIFNSNPFVSGRTLTIKTGTWSCPFDRVASFLSKRVDLYTFQISNYHLVDDSGTMDCPLIGDWVRLKSIKIPNEVKELDILIVSKAQDEQVTEYTGYSFT